MESPKVIYLHKKQEHLLDEWFTKTELLQGEIVQYVRSDLAKLSWTDIRELISIIEEVEQENDCLVKVKSDLCEEVATRFNQLKSKKVQ